jgi:hypothetical protein
MPPEEKEKKEEKVEVEYVVVLMRKKNGQGIMIFPHIDGSDLSIEREATNSDIAAILLEAIEIIRSKMAATQVMVAMSQISRGLVTTKGGIEIPTGSSLPSELRGK